MIVVMHFGDGTQKIINVDAVQPEVAVIEARDWVMDNAWFETYDISDQVVAETRLDSDLSRR